MYFLLIIPMKDFKTIFLIVFSPASLSTQINSVYVAVKCTGFVAPFSRQDLKIGNRKGS